MGICSGLRGANRRDVSLTADKPVAPSKEGALLFSAPAQEHVYRQRRRESQESFQQLVRLMIKSTPPAEKSGREDMKERIWCLLRPFHLAWRWATCPWGDPLCSGTMGSPSCCESLLNINMPLIKDSNIILPPPIFIVQRHLINANWAEMNRILIKAPHLHQCRNEQLKVFYSGV